MEACGPPARSAGIDAIPLDLDIGGADAGHLALIGSVHQIVAQVEAGQRSDQTEHIVAHHASGWQSAHRLFREHCADG